MAVESLPTYSIRELNQAIGNLLERGFAPRFLLEASVLKPQIKKGHLWLTLTDGDASISAVIWASKLKQITYMPKDDDGVLVIGKLNFWATRALLNVQVLDIRPKLSTVLRQFEIVRSLLLKEGLINESRRKSLPTHPKAIAILTSVPSSALADMLRTAKERWPLTKLFILPIPVQGDVAQQIESSIIYLAKNHPKLRIDTVILARGGGSREDLMVFDDEKVCRAIASFPIPLITGIGHEDDLTVADLVSDFRAATPTAAVIAALPNREASKIALKQLNVRLIENCYWILKKERHRLNELKSGFSNNSPIEIIKKYRNHLKEKMIILEAYSPETWLRRGFSIVKNKLKKPIKSVDDVSLKEYLEIEVSDGAIHVITKEINRKEESL